MMTWVDSDEMIIGAGFLSVLRDNGYNILD